MQFGQRKTTLETSLTLIDKYYEGEISRTVIQHTSRVRVSGPEDEAAEYLNFSEMLRQLRSQGVLTWDQDDKSTLPSFTIKYPAEDGGFYQVILTWCENVLESA